MPDEPSGVFAVVVATTLGLVVLAGVIVFAVRLFT